MWHNEIGGFDESMESWEDVDYHWRMARAGKCYIRIREPLVFYRFDSGTRRQAANPETNSKTATKLLQYIHTKYERINVMPCITCGGNQISTNYPSNPVAVQQSARGDADFQIVLYNHPNKGDHVVVGPSTGINYGYRSGGDKFLVHNADISLMPQLFIQLNNIALSQHAPVEAIVPPPAPVAIRNEPAPLPELKKFNINAVPGITPEIAGKLSAMGYDSEDKFMEIDEEVLKFIDEISPTRSRIILAFVDQMKEKNAK
jgi:hypothetical protein